MGRDRSESEKGLYQMRHARPSAPGDAALGDPPGDTAPGDAAPGDTRRAARHALRLATLPWTSPRRANRSIMASWNSDFSVEAA